MASRAIVFDAYGTLLDLATAVEPHVAALGDRSVSLLALWRAKQLEYTWLRTLMGRYADFARITRDALDYACDSLGCAPQPTLREALLDAFHHLRCYADAADSLERLRAAGVRTAILSNGTPGMLGSALRASGLDAKFDAVLSADAVRRYKPDPLVYRMATDAFRCAPSELVFVSANAWDVAGAAAFGCATIWVNRSGAAPERLDPRPTAVVGALAEIPDVLDQVIRTPGRTPS
jgi:2-haloacid dehalogenase